MVPEFLACDDILYVYQSRGFVNNHDDVIHLVLKIVGG